LFVGELSFGRHVSPTFWEVPSSQDTARLVLSCIAQDVMHSRAAGLENILLGTGAMRFEILLTTPYSLARSLGSTAGAREERSEESEVLGLVALFGVEGRFIAGGIERGRRQVFIIECHL
jgi:hypothetical protein